VRTFLLILVILVAKTAAAAGLTPVQKTQVLKIAESVKAAAANYQSGDYEAAGESVAASMDLIEETLQDAGPELFDVIAPAFPRLIKAQAMLELEGVTVRPFAVPVRPAVEPAKPKPPRPVVPKPVSRQPKTMEPALPAASANPFSSAVETISFTKTVAPILVEHCGKCHVSGSKGNFSMASFRQLAKGPPEGTVIFAGDVLGSRLIETIETGDMPRGGKVPPDQLKTLKDWIAGGAKYDGPSPDVPLASLVTVKPMTQNREEVVANKPTGNETVSFSEDIAPLLLKNCNGCHIGAMRDSGGLRMDNFAQILRGGDSGAIVEGGKSAMSLLVRKLKGEEGDRMPAGGRPPLSDDSITLISRWIDEGAVLDGESAEQPIEMMSALAWAKSATDGELNERRVKQAAVNLKLVANGQPASDGITTEHFYVLGGAGDGTLKLVSELAEKAWKEVSPFVVQEGVRGRVTIFVSSRRYDYSEFAKMVEQRSLPTDWQSHWRYDGIDAYIAMVATSEDKDAALKAKLISPLASLAVVMRNSDTPRWFAEGVGRVAASKLVPRDLPQVESWNRDLPSAFATMKDGAQFIKTDLPPEQSDLVAYGVVSVMISRGQRRQYDTLLRTLPGSPSFDEAFLNAFAITPTDYVTRLKQTSGR